MTPKERAIAALEVSQPDDLAPTFELEFQLTQEFFGKEFKGQHGLSGDELDRAVGYNAELFVEVAEALDYSIIRTGSLELLRKLVKIGAGEKYLLCGEADGTMSIPNGENMMEVAIELVEGREGLHQKLERSAKWAMDAGKAQLDAGAECLTMCADYCFNQGPFLSPKKFAEFVTPYLHRVIESHRKSGAYVIKHTDGNLMPVLDQIVSCEPHALHSVDPQGGMDLAEVKRLYGDRLCLCGNVNCGLLQTGTDREVIVDVLRSLRDGMPGGGFIFCTSNVAFKGMPTERYRMMLELRKRYGRYDRPTDFAALDPAQIERDMAELDLTAP
jgi:uroporphyrinogen decarboxylase